MTYTDTVLLDGSTGKRDTDGGIYSSDCKRFLALAVKDAEAYHVAEGTEAVAGRAFANCRALRQLTLPTSLTELGGMACVDCDSLTAIQLPHNIRKIRSNPFCTHLRMTVESPHFQTDGTSLLSADGTVLLAFTDAEAETYRMPDGVRRVAEHAFYGCSSLKSIVFAKSVCEVAADVFEGCTSLQEVTVGRNVRFKTLQYAAWDFLKTDEMLWAGGDIRLLPEEKSVGVVCGHKIRISHIK